MDDDRIALFLDYENLAIGARDHLGGMSFDLKPITDALAVRGNVIVRRAYADWSYFDEDRRRLTRAHVELIELPQKMGASRKNAADIKMAVDALEIAFERDYISTFVLCTGDSDFTPLVTKLRELDKRVIGIGVRGSTSALLPSACDEFLYYDTLEGVDPPATGGGRAPARRDRPAAPAPPADVAVAEPQPEALDAGDDAVGDAAGVEEQPPDLAVLVAQALAELNSSDVGGVTASVLKRTLLRRDPTFSEADYGFRGFGELLRHLAERKVVELGPGPAAGDPEVELPEHGGRAEAFDLLVAAVGAADSGAGVPLSGLKDRIRRTVPDFSEKPLGYRSFLQFSKAASTAGLIELSWDDTAEDYLVRVAAD